MPEAFPLDKSLFPQQNTERGPPGLGEAANLASVAGPITGKSHLHPALPSSPQARQPQPQGTSSERRPEPRHQLYAPLSPSLSAHLFLGRRSNPTITAFSYLPNTGADAPGSSRGCPRAAVSPHRQLARNRYEKLICFRDSEKRPRSARTQVLSLPRECDPFRADSASTIFT